MFFQSKRPCCMFSNKSNSTTVCAWSRRIFFTMAMRCNFKIDQVIKKKVDFCSQPQKRILNQLPDTLRQIWLHQRVPRAKTRLEPPLNSNRIANSSRKKEYCEILTCPEAKKSCFFNFEGTTWSFLVNPTIQAFSACCGASFSLWWWAGTLKLTKLFQKNVNYRPPATKSHFWPPSGHVTANLTSPACCSC